MGDLTGFRNIGFKNSSAPSSLIGTALLVLFSAASGAATAQDSYGVHENGIGADPDHDTNPATDTGNLPLYNAIAGPAENLPYSVITFEPPPGKHGEAIIRDYKRGYGVEFSDGLSWQICQGQKRFAYDTMCTYEAPPSGKFSAGYKNHRKTPLVITFERPVCVATLSVYPTGGKEGERFELTIEGWSASGVKLPVSKAEFEWTKNTVRWRNMAGAYFIHQRAAKIAVSLRSKDWTQRRDTLRFLIDDLAYVDENCDAAFDNIEARTGVDLRNEAPSGSGRI